MTDQTTTIFETEAAESLTFNRLPYQIRSRLNEFSGAELKVWLCLLSHANNIDKRAWAGIKLLMRETGLSRHGVDDALAGLHRKGWVRRCRHMNRTTGQWTTSSTFCKWAPVVKGSHWERIEERSRTPKSGVRA